MARSELRVVYTTFPDKSSAQTVGEFLIRERLAACVNLLPVAASLYVWKGKINRGGEVAALVKTTKLKIKKVLRVLEEKHPYNCPCVIAVTPEMVNKAYEQWAKGQLK